MKYEYFNIRIRTKGYRVEEQIDQLLGHISQMGDCRDCRFTISTQRLVKLLAQSKALFQSLRELFKQELSEKHKIYEQYDQLYEQYEKLKDEQAARKPYLIPGIEYTNCLYKGELLQEIVDKLPVTQDSTIQISVLRKPKK